MRAKVGSKKFFAQNLSKKDAINTCKPKLQKKVFEQDKSGKESGEENCSQSLEYYWSKSTNIVLLVC